MFSPANNGTSDFGRREMVGEKGGVAFVMPWCCCGICTSDVGGEGCNDGGVLFSSFINFTVMFVMIDCCVAKDLCILSKSSTSPCNKRYLVYSNLTVGYTGRIYDKIYI